MARSLTREQLLDRLTGLCDEDLDNLIRSGIVRPTLSARGPTFQELDEARLRLILDLSDAYELDPDGMALVMSLIDRLTTLRGDMQAMLRALAEEAPETRARMRQVIHETRITLRAR